MRDIALFPDQASTTAHAVDELLYFLLAVCGAVGLLVAFLLFYFSIRYRRRPGDETTPPETIPSRALEWFWTLSPLGAFAVMFIWGALVYVRAYSAPADATTIYCVGKQWMWKFQHPEGQREINTLHVPAGRPIRVLLTSEDVIHSFFVPAFRIHMDALPDRYTSVWFEATKPGTYHLFCSQYCGTGHADMVGTIVVQKSADFQDWLESQAEGSLALQGRKIFLKHRCLSCHSADAVARAPVLEGLYVPGPSKMPVHLQDGRVVPADEQYLRESILHAGAKIVAGYENIMPTFAGQITEEEVIALIAYIESLGPGATPARVEDFPPPVRVESPDDNARNLPGAEVKQP